MEFIYSTWFRIVERSWKCWNTDHRVFQYTILTDDTDLKSHFRWTELYWLYGNTQSESLEYPLENHYFLSLIIEHSNTFQISVHPWSCIVNCYHALTLDLNVVSRTGKASKLIWRNLKQFQNNKGKMNLIEELFICCCIPAKVCTLCSWKYNKALSTEDCKPHNIV